VVQEIEIIAHVQESTAMSNEIERRKGKAEIDAGTEMVDEKGGLQLSC
jgi:hypothetical protein